MSPVVGLQPADGSTCRTAGQIAGSDTWPVSCCVSTPALSVLIPTYNERGSLPFLLRDLAGLHASYEVVVADGGGSDGTARIAAEQGAMVVACERGRGTQLAAAAKAARAPVLCALHADIRLPAATLAAIDAYAAAPLASALAFSLAIDGAGVALRLIAAGANARSRVFHLPYGDQGLLMTRRMYDQAGGYRPVPIMEDVLLARALARSAGIAISDEHVVVSARRWERDGPWLRSLRNIALLTAFLAGASPARLARWYDAPRPIDSGG